MSARRVILTVPRRGIHDNHEIPRYRSPPTTASPSCDRTTCHDAAYEHPMSYPVLSRPVSAPLPTPVPWYMPTHMTTHTGNHDWTQAQTFQQQHQAQVTQQLPQGVAPIIQQHRQPQTPHDPSTTGLPSLNVSGLSGVQFSPMPSQTTCRVTSESIHHRRSGGTEFSDPAE